MDISEHANIQVWNNDKSAMLVSDGTLTQKSKTYKGKEIGSSKIFELIDVKEVFLEAIDELPEVMQKVVRRE
jgi:hypothetical protein